jgi:hypothetical protein
MYDEGVSFPKAWLHLSLDKDDSVWTTTDAEGSRVGMAWRRAWNQMLWAVGQQVLVGA